MPPVLNGEAARLTREISWLKALLETRLDAMDKAILLLQAFADRTPTTMDVQHQVKILEGVTCEKFVGVGTQIKERDIALTSTAEDNRHRVDAAFSAAKEQAVEQGRTFQKQLDSLSEKIADIKDRMITIESRTSVTDPSTQVSLAKLGDQVANLGTGASNSQGRVAGMQALWALIAGVIGLLLGAGSFIALMVK